MAEVGILLFDQVEVLDCCGPFEVFSTASRVALRLGWPSPPFRVHTIAPSADEVTARGGLRLLASHTLDNHPPLDILVVPGGVTGHAEGDDRLIEWIHQVGSATELTASVCTGAFLLAAAGLLDGLRATTHWEDVEELDLRFPAVTLERQVRWVDEGRVVTSAGISAGIDMSLHLVERSKGEELARVTARQMDYQWQRDSLRNVDAERT